MFDKDGKALPVTLGLDPAMYMHLDGDDWELRRGKSLERGVNFEFIIGVPSFHPYGFGMNSLRSVKPGNDFIAFCRGKNPSLPVLSYTHPESRQFVMSMIQNSLASGVDGVDLRLSSHCSTFEPMAYGFNPPAVEEYKRRYGVDVLTEDFDFFQWQRLQGEYLTTLIRESAQLIHRQGKKCHVHLGHYCETDDGRSQYCYMSRQHAWRDWINEGLIDGITMRNEGEESLHYLQLREETATTGLPLILNRRHWNTFPGENWIDNQTRHASSAIKAGMDGFMLYENYDVFRLGDKPGDIRPIVPGFKEMIKTIRSNE